MSVHPRESLLGETGFPGEVLPVRYEGPRAFGWWGMAWLIGTEATLFALLIASYFYLRFRNDPTWPPEGIATPELGLPLVMTAILWSSSIPVHVADRGIRVGDLGRLKAGLAAGFVLGGVFLAMSGPRSSTSSGRRPTSTDRCSSPSRGSTPPTCWWGC
jgi:hypothetical protein